MYHQNTLKIFSSQYLGMFAVYTHEISKDKASYLRLNRVSHEASKTHVLQPRYVPCGRCGHGKGDSQNTERPPLERAPVGRLTSS